MEPHRAAGFATTTANSFIAEYIAKIKENKPLGELGAWLIENAKNLKEAMFFDPNVDWEEVKPYHMLPLRAVGPAGVFTLTAKGGFLTQFGGNADFAAIADALFCANDVEFLNRLPKEFEPTKSVLIQLMQIAYRMGIRKADERVKKM